MTADAALVDAGLRAWQGAVERSDIFLRALTDAQLRTPVAPGRNRLVYLWGHLIAVHDRMLPLLGAGDRLHPELDEAYLSKPDDPAARLHSAAELAPMWAEVNAALWAAMERWTADDWAARHTAVTAEQFHAEPHRNRFSVLLSRTAHLASHQGQMILAMPRSSTHG